MIENYKFKPIAFSSIHVNLHRLINIKYYRSITKRMITYIINKYDGKIKNNTDDDNWYNLIIEQKGINPLYNVKEILPKVFNDNKLLYSIPFYECKKHCDKEYLMNISIDEKLREYDLNIFQTLGLTTSYIMGYFSDLYMLMRIRKAFPGSYHIRIFFNDIIFTLVNRFSNFLVQNRKISDNKIFDYIHFIEKLLNNIVNTVVEEKKISTMKIIKIKKLLPNDIFEQYSDDFDKLYSLALKHQYAPNHLTFNPYKLYDFTIYILTTSRDINNQNIIHKWFNMLNNSNQSNKDIIFTQMKKEMIKKIKHCLLNTKTNNETEMYILSNDITRIIMYYLILKLHYTNENFSDYTNIVYINDKKLKNRIKNNSDKELVEATAQQIAEKCIINPKPGVNLITI